MAKRGLGRGLDSLIPNRADSVNNKETSSEAAKDTEAKAGSKTPENQVKASSSKNAAMVPDAAGKSAEKFPASEAASKMLSSPESTAENIVMMKTTRMEPNKDQPRKAFDENALNELAASIKQYGIIQPVIVCKKGSFYEIIAGERRWRAAKIAGLSEIPVIIKNYADKERAEVSLIENIQRENLNPIEEAAAYKQLMDEYNLTQETLAEKISKSRAAVANTMRLLKLNAKVQEMVIKGMLSGGHARALLAIEDEEKQLKAAEQIIEKKLNVRQTEDLVKDINTKQQKTKTKDKPEDDYLYKDLENNLADTLGTKVRISRRDKGGGKIEISYFTDYDLDRIYRILHGRDSK